MNNMTKVFESAMNAPFNLSTMLKNINTHHILGNLSDDERNKLEEVARCKADPAGGLDVMAKLQELDERVTELEKAKKTEDDTPVELPPEFVPGKWYYMGDTMTFNGIVYVCTAPKGQVCVWSPTEYPDYWETQPV